MTVCVGIDVSKKTLDVCILFDDSERVFNCLNCEEGFVELVSKLAHFNKNDVRICLEATNIYHRKLTQFLYDAGYFVVVENPAKIHHFMKMQFSRLKTDKQDARLIARYCKLDGLRRWRPSSLCVSRLIQLIDAIRYFTEMRKSLYVKLHDVGDGFCRDSFSDAVSYLSMRIKLLASELRHLFADNADLREQRRILMSIPGVGSLTASILLSVFLSRDFTKASQLVAYFGLNPRMRRSGTSISGREHISKMGKRNLRSALYMPALSVYRYKKFACFISRLEFQKKNAMVIITALMRKILIFAFTLFRKREMYDDSLVH